MSLQITVSLKLSIYIIILFWFSFDQRLNPRDTIPMRESKSIGRHGTPQPHTLLSAAAAAADAMLSLAGYRGRDTHRYPPTPLPQLQNSLANAEPIIFGSLYY